MSAVSPEPDKAGGYVPGCSNLIEEDRACESCGYNLHGLPLSGRCPECGAPIRRPAVEDRPLSEMPPAVINRFCFGGWACTACVLGAILTMAGGKFLPWQAWVEPGVLTILACAWLGAVVLITPTIDVPEARLHGFIARSRVRIAARALQLGWVAWCVVELGRAAGGPPPTSWDAALEVVSMVSGLTGLAGIIVLAFVLQRLAEWVRDDVAEKAFGWAIWGMPVFGVLNAVVPPILLVSIVLFLLLVVSVAAFPFGVLSLSRSIEYSVRHAREHEARDRRRAERLRRYDEQVAQRVSSIDKARERSDST